MIVVCQGQNCLGYSTSVIELGKYYMDCEKKKVFYKALNEKSGTKTIQKV